MGTKMTAQKIEKTIDEMVDELEVLGTEIELKMKLASMDARDLWQKKLEPRFFDARTHAREAKDASKHAIQDTIKALKEFADSL
jgi:hypothetical protein